MYSEVKINFQQDYAIAIEGDLHQANAAAFEKRLAECEINPDAVALDMLEFDVSDGIAIVTTINAIRQILTRTKKLKLVAAPQILCHNLYRVGLFGIDSRIELVAMREDEPYA
ncbi:MAG: hypothetical protein AB1757_14195 [Acidobacteriota bacterium]